MLKPENTQKNRDLKLMGCDGGVMFVKYDIVYFKLNVGGKEVLLQCGKGIFNRNFKTDEGLEEVVEKIDKKILNKFNDYAALKKI